MRLTVLALLVTCSACASMAPPTHVVHPQRDWRAAATATDRARLRDWRGAFISGLAAARAGGHAAEIVKEGVLLQPDAALGGGSIPNGTYRCRVIKIGARSQGMLDYVAYPYFTCRVQPDGELQSFVKLTGSQRQVGLIFPGDAMRQIFLGTLMLGDEGRAMHYGADPERDVAGFIERIGPARWRLVMPQPHFESQIDVMELVPASLGVRLT